jgi:integrase
MRCKLTKSSIADAQPRATPYQLHDSEVQGFLLRIEPSGARAYYLEYRTQGGRRCRYRIGTFPAIDPEHARRIAKVAAGEAASGIDIQARKKEQRKDHELVRRQTLRVFLDEQYEPWVTTNLRSGAAAMERLRVDFKAWLDRPMTGFNRWLIEGWRKKELERGLAATTVNRGLQRLQGALSRAVQWGVIPSHPFAGLKPLRTDRRGRVRFLSPEEEQRLRDALLARERGMRAERERFNHWRAIRHLKPLPGREAEFVDHVRPAVLLALNTGLRRGELLGLKWADVDLSVRLLTVVSANSKSGQTRRIPLNLEATDILTRWKAQQASVGADRYLFAAHKGRRMLNFDTSWRGVRAAAQLGDCRFHDLRHHFASRLVQEGTDLNVVRELLGHSDLVMVLRYAHLDPRNLAVAVERVARPAQLA